MPLDRARGREVHFYNVFSPAQALGGLRLNDTMTEKAFLSMLQILIIASQPYSVSLRGTGVALTPTDNLLRPGDYDIIPNSPGGTIFITDEHSILRVPSSTVTGRDERFRQRVRERDKKCVITGSVNSEADLDEWSGFEAAHIFPIAGETLWISNGFSRWITNRKDEHDTGINSCQNGLLMLSNIHKKFDSYFISVNPDDDYKIISFSRGDPFHVAGRVLDLVCRAPNNEKSARDELLRWHFRQAVLANLRGAGEPSFETDFPPGSDMVGEILSGPQAAKRMEAELFSRLNGVPLAQGSLSQRPL
ncbi:HNH endonuclease-domain-containing protein [Lipomyces starkeyi]